jgi:methionyl-tRNA formyltransferase
VASQTPVVVLSSTSFGRRCIEEGILPAEGVYLAAVVTTESRIPISYSDKPITISQYEDLEPVASRQSAALFRLRPDQRLSDLFDELSRWQGGILLALGWYYMVPSSIRRLFEKGSLAIHASLLPKYRGGAPIPWAIINGERATGVSLFHLERGVDTGDIVAQRPIDIADEDTCATIYGRASAASIEMLREILPMLARGEAPRYPQDESRATSYPQRSPEDGWIDWNRLSARQTFDWVRAQTRPYPGAYTYLEGRRVTLWRVALRDESSGLPPGSVAAFPPDVGVVDVVCADGGLVRILEISVDDDAAVDPVFLFEDGGVDYPAMFRSESKNRHGGRK